MWIENVHPDDRAHVLASIERQDTGQVTYNTFQYRERHADGHWVWIESRGASVAYGPDGKPSRIIGTDTDITPRKEAEARLEEISRRLRLALDVSKIGVFDHNLETQETIWDERILAIYGLNPDDGAPSGRSWEDMLHPDDREMAIARVNDGVAAGAPFGSLAEMIGFARREPGRRRWTAQRAVGGPVGQQLRQFYGLAQRGQRGAPALLARLDDLGLQPLALDAFDDRAFGDHRLQPRDAQLGRLFDDPVEPCLLDRRKAQPQVGHLFDHARLTFDVQR
eukprot:gene4393-5599_t